MGETGSEIKYKPIHYGKIAGMKMEFQIEVREKGRYRGRESWAKRDKVHFTCMRSPSRGRAFRYSIVEYCSVKRPVHDKFN
jgi:hypothetical protein